MAKSPAIKPLFSNVLIKPMEQETQTASGIYLPQNVKEKPQMGTVMAIGEGDTSPEGKKMPMVVKIGDKVLYKKWGGNEIKVEDEEWLIVEQKDIMAVLS